MRWPLTPDDKQAVVDKLMAIINSDDWPCGLRAVRILVEMEAQNLADEDSDANEFRQRLEKMLERLQSTNEN